MCLDFVGRNKHTLHLTRMREKAKIPHPKSTPPAFEGAGMVNSSGHSTETVRSLFRERPEGQWRNRRLIAGCIISVLLTSVALAYAIPPDPCWIAGFYDDGDYDDVAGMMTDMTG